MIITAPKPVTTQRQLRPVRLHDLPELVRLANEDQHVALAPTHVFEKNGELVGCVSLAVITLVLPWFHTQRCQPRDSLHFIREMESILTRDLPDAGTGWICVPVVTGSPFHPHIERLGYAPCSTTTTLAFKKVK